VTSVLRVLLSPRYVALVLLACLLAAAFVSLGRWQYHRAHTVITTQQQSGLAAVSLTSIILPRTPVPGSDVALLVNVTGRYDPAGQLIVPDRTPRGIPTGPADRPVGVWVLTPLVTEQHMVVPVVRGWARNAASVTPPPTGSVDVSGRLYASESSALRDPNQNTLPAGQIDIVSGAELVSRWSGDLLDGYVTVVHEEPAGALLRPVTPSGPPPSYGLHWRNAVYAVQWWCFAMFVLFFAFRVIRDEARRREGLGGTAEPVQPSDPVAPPPASAG
jgi:cytochrome oxidase assembly protein ShyY1